MEEFEKIDWLPNVEDIIDDKFIDEERLKKESAMYSILNGTFEDPFQDIRNPNFHPFKKQSSPKKTNTGNNETPKKMKQNTENNETPKKMKQNTENNETPKKMKQNTENNEGTPSVKKQRGRPKKKKN